jgi:LmbE family N-acetylglucosaminyl deacetylase
MRKIFLGLLILGCLSDYTSAQVPKALPASKILHDIQKLNVLGSVLYIAAHPDDENTRLITWLANEKKYRTAYLSLTRGDGGQNLIGDEQGVELGLIRTQELMAARRIDGGEQFFTRAYDFGYSKNPEETFRIWNKDSILADVVWVIRRFQPDVIITRFPTTGEGGHGHHTASAILANEAFSAAADPKRFPEQLKYVSVWQAKRILWNTFNFGSTNTTAANQFKLDVGGFNPLLGASYGELAAESRSQHKSQGFGVPSTRGESFEYFKVTGGPSPQNELLEEVNRGWSRIQAPVGISMLIDSLVSQFDAASPERSLPRLIKLHTMLNSLPVSQWRDYKLERVRQIILQCAGFYAEAISTQPSVVVGDTLRFTLNLIARSTTDLRVQSISYSGKDTALSLTLPMNRTFSLPVSLWVASAKSISQPYWLVSPMQPGRFDVRDPLLVGSPESRPAFRLSIDLSLNGESMKLEVPVVHKLTDPVRGEIFKPLIVRPTIEIFAEKELAFLNGEKGRAELSFKLQANQSLSGARVRAVNNNQSVELGELPVMDKGKNVVRTKSLTVSPGIYTYQYQSAAGQEISQAGGLTRIEYTHVPEIHYFRAGPQRIVSIDLKTMGKRIGYVEGAGDKVAEALERMGYEVVLLSGKELLRSDLTSFDAIVTGVRAYNTHAWLNEAHEQLMKYVELGGNLIVQYNTSSQIGPIRAKIGPYPFSITRNRVTDEMAAVSFLNPTHPVFNRPNRLGSADFDQWVQERSIYHGSDTTGRFERLLSMSDPGERSDDGSLLITRYGKGWFTYTGLALFRQLPAGVPGAYRLLANLIALNAKESQ